MEWQQAKPIKRDSTASGRLYLSCWKITLVISRGKGELGNVPSLHKKETRGGVKDYRVFRLKLIIKALISYNILIDFFILFIFIFCIIDFKSIHSNW